MREFRKCLDCGEEKPTDPISRLCVDCLILAARAKNKRPDVRAEAARSDE